MKCNKQVYQIGIGMINKGLQRIGFDAKETIDIVRYVDYKYKIKD